MNGINNTQLVIFGGTGDLCYRKLMPALYNLFIKGNLTSCDRIIAIGRREYSQEEYKEIIKEWIIKFARFDKNEDDLSAFFQRIHYLKMDFTKEEQYKQLSEIVDVNISTQYVFYYAVAPHFFEIISKGISTIDTIKSSRIVIEKPFGETLERAEKLNTYLENTFSKENIYRIDHYLGKEVVRSILSIRSTNLLFMQVWNKENIEKVAISAREEVGIGSRGAFYDKTGAMKDMLQNHLLQILSLVAMELPNSLNDIEAVQKKQEDLLLALRNIEKVEITKDLVLAQYESYRDEEHVAPNSNTESYVKTRLYIDNARWQDVPFILTTGKKLAKRAMEVEITFKAVGTAPTNKLVFEVQPREGVVFSFNIKEPGESNDIIPVNMDFCQSCQLDFNNNTPEAYERLINAVFKGDRAWFSTWGQIATSWKYVEALKNEYLKHALPILIYKQDEDEPDFL